MTVQYPSLGTALSWAASQQSTLDRGASRPYDAACCACGVMGHRMPMDVSWIAVGACSNRRVVEAMIETGLPRSTSGYWAFCGDCRVHFLDSQRGKTAWTLYITAIGAPWTHY